MQELDPACNIESTVPTQNQIQYSVTLAARSVRNSAGPHRTRLPRFRAARHSPAHARGRDFGASSSDRTTRRAKAAELVGSQPSQIDARLQATWTRISAPGCAAANQPGPEVIPRASGESRSPSGRLQRILGRNMVFCLPWCPRSRLCRLPGTAGHLIP
ncbi:hypothetical protein BD413DRAFT_8400 [Trametes elegans]|nr:hypothetical protein BD413DRAFT_8400 [Trametes elegans]